jgi:putative membrane protein
VPIYEPVARAEIRLPLPQISKCHRKATGSLPPSEEIDKHMKATLLFYMLALGAVVGLSHSASAQEHHHKLTDEVFAKKAAAGGLTEVELGKLAQQNGGSQDVKDFGAKMVTDHGKANDALTAVATKDKLTIPNKPNTEQQALIDKLSKETGMEFDKAYVHAMVKAHIGDKALFTEEVASAKNPDLKQFAEDTLPVITSHLDMIEGMAKGESAGSTTPATGR